MARVGALVFAADAGGAGGIEHGFGEQSVSRVLGGRRVRFSVTILFGWFGLGLENGFVRQFFAEGFEALEVLDRAAVVALGLGLIAQEQGPGIGAADHAMEAFAQQEVAILGLGNEEVAIASDFLSHDDDGIAVGVKALVEAEGEEAHFEAGGAEEGLLGEGDALDGEDLLGVDGLVNSHGVGLEVGDLLEVFEADNAVGGSGEAMFAC